MLFLPDNTLEIYELLIFRSFLTFVLQQSFQNNVMILNLKQMIDQLFGKTS